MVTSYGIAEVFSKMAALMCLMNDDVVLLKIIIVMPRCSVTKMKSCRQHTVATASAAGPRLGNPLPVQLRNPDITHGLFRRQLKGHLVGKHEHGAL